jgi:hypothetical protein
MFYNISDNIQYKLAPSSKPITNLLNEKWNKVYHEDDIV